MGRLRRSRRVVLAVDVEARNVDVRVCLRSVHVVSVASEALHSQNLLGEGALALLEMPPLAPTPMMLLPEMVPTEVKTQAL